MVQWLEATGRPWRNETDGGVSTALLTGAARKSNRAQEANGRVREKLGAGRRLL